MIGFRIAAAGALGLELAGQFVHDHGWLPLAGSHIAQIGLVFGVTFILYELKDTIAEGWKRLQHRMTHRSRS